MLDLPILSGVQILEEARKLVGTPWKHTGRIPGVGLDCVGVLVITYNSLGVKVPDDLDYSQFNEWTRMVKKLSEFHDRLRKNITPLPGDLLVFHDDRVANHVGISNGEGGMIHAYGPGGVNRVVDHEVAPEWPLERIYRYKNWRAS